MKQRVLTGVIGAAVVIAWLFSLYTPIFPIVLALATGITAYEMLNAFEIKNHLFRAISMILSMIIPLYINWRDKINIPMYPVITGIIIISLVIMVCDFKELKFEQVSCSLVANTLIPISLSSIILFRDVYITYPDLYKKSDGIFFILFAFFACWLSDTFALFAGKAFGKHKLCPEISPKKTVEGAIGGIIGSTLMNVVLFLVFKFKFDLSPKINIAFVLIAGIFLSVISIFGDLAASTIKRHHGIKDFGNLLPGHGGLMDRFDSSSFVFPCLYAIIAIISAI